MSDGRGRSTGSDGRPPLPSKASSGMSATRGGGPIPPPRVSSMSHHHLGVNPRISGQAVNIGPAPPPGRMMPFGVYAPPPPPGMHPHFPMPPHHRPPPPHSMPGGTHHQAMMTRHGGQRSMIPPPIVVSASAKKHQRPTLLLSSSATKNLETDSPPSLSTRPPRWTENEVSTKYLLLKFYAYD